MYTNNKIEEQSYQYKGLENIEIPSNIDEIGKCAFFMNKLSEVIIPSSVKTIGISAFQNNSIQTIQFLGDIESIGDFAFSSNKIEKLSIPRSISIIEAYSFSNNCIEELVIPDNIVEIRRGAFYNNKIKNVTIPLSVTKIESGAFDAIDIQYGDKLISSEYIKKFGCENIINIYNIMTIVPNFNFEVITKEILQIIPKDNDSIKGFTNNHNIFSSLVNKFDIPALYDNSSEEYASFYKLCYTLGLFHTGNVMQAEVIDTITKMMDLYLIEEIKTMFTDIKIERYIDRFRKIVISEYNHPKLSEVITLFYNNFDDIVSHILKGKKEQIGILNAQNRNNSTPSLESQLKKLKEQKKLVTIDDVINYLKENIFIVKKGNEDLLNIVDTLSSFVNQQDFDVIQEIYKQAVASNDNNPKIFQPLVDRKQDGMHYYWSMGDNPINIILGYLCNCCAKYKGTGQDIMVQSMINPNIKNLIIYDSMRNVVGKTTAFYNYNQKYILFNNIEIKRSFLDSDKTDITLKKEVLKAIKRGIDDQVVSMVERGYPVDDIRIGMKNNDLEDAIVDSGIEIIHTNFLENYPFNGYIGDASDEEKGQAIIKRK